MPSSSARRSALGSRLLDVAIVPVLLLLWEVGARAGVIDSVSFPAPSEIATTVVSLVADGFPTGITALNHIWASTIRIVVGFAIAVMLAVPLGLVLGRTTVLRRLCDPIINFARSIAALGLLPLFVAWFGVGETTRLLLVAYAAFWVVLVNTIAAVMSVDPVYVEAARALGANRRQVFVQVTLVASLPRIFTGLKVALGVAFLVIVAVEMVGTEEGVGALISQARTFFRSDIAMAGMVFIACMGIVLAALMDWLESALLPWRKGLEGRR